MNILFLVEFTTSILFLWLIVYVLYKNPRSILNRTYALLLGCFVIWNLFSAYYTAAETKESAIFWSNISSIGWCSFPAFALWFTLVFTRKEKILKKWYFYFFILIIPAFFIYKQWAGDLANDNIKLIYGWNSVWARSILSYTFFAYYFSFVIISILLILFSIKKSKKSYEKKQAVIIVITSIIPIVLGAVTNILLPVFKIDFIPQLGNIFSLIWTGGIVYAITRYGLMTLTISYAASDILKTMSDSLILIDPDGRIIEINNTALDILGYKRDEIIGKPAEMLFPQGIDQIMGSNRKELLKEKSFKDRQDFFRSKIGKIIPVTISSSVMRDKDDILVGIVYVARNMREILRLQEKERIYTIEKARSEALQERTIELQKAYDKLRDAQAMLLQSEKMSAVGQLAGGIAHEINNPMGVILGFAQSIGKKINEGDPLYKPLKSIEREAVRCRKLIVDLLAFSRKEKSQAESVDINQTIDETLSLIESQTKLMNIKINRKYKTDLPEITANKNQIQQVVVNICNNAIDAMPDGGSITITTDNYDGQVIIEISDTGKGIDEETKKHIFESFYTTKEAGNHAGLGLSLCYEIIQKHKGTIKVESEAGKESTFMIKLPIT